MGGRLFVLGLVGALAGAIACTGGTGSPSGMDSPWSQPPGSTFESPPTSGESPGSSLDPAPASADSPSGSPGGGGGCPPCGTYLCKATVTVSSSGGTPSTTTTTVPIPLSKQSDGSCAFTSKNDSVILKCGGSIVDESGKPLGSWSTSGTTITLTSADPKDKPTTCTVGSSSTPTPTPTPVPTGTATSVPTATPVPTAPPPAVDAGF